MIDISAIKPGDKVTVEIRDAVVGKVLPSGVALATHFFRSGFICHQSCITSHTASHDEHDLAPRPVAVGDAIHWPVSATRSIKATILAIDSGIAWIKDEGGNRTQLPVQGLMHWEDGA